MLAFKSTKAAVRRVIGFQKGPELLIHVPSSCKTLFMRQPVLTNAVVVSRKTACKLRGRISS